MVVAPEVSQLSGFSAVIGGNTIRGLSTRRASTTVELGNGESLVLGGLLQRNTREDIAKVPGLGDIPILGALFRSAEYQRDETELMIIVTPYIVRPTSERLATPLDGFQSPTDYELYAWGAMYRDSTGSMPERVGTLRGQELVGRVGFHIE
jgi:pilus assembly protein CpaC